MRHSLLATFLMSISLYSFGTTWYNPVQHISGRWWDNENSGTYYRMPDRFKESVTGGVWGLSRHSAGEYIKFTTDSKNITVKYILTDNKNLQMWHMPSTGVSGIDLYLTNNKGEEHWCASDSRSFSDTVTYYFKDLFLSPL